MLPTDPVMRLSYVNTKLRDFYGNLDLLCQDLDVDKQELIDSLAKIDYHYEENQNQFI